MKRIIICLLVLGCILCVPFAASAQAADAPSEATEKTQIALWVEEISQVVGQYAGEILATVTLAVSLLNTYRYQKGLLPTLYHGLQGVKTAYGKGEEATQEALKATQNELRGFLEEMAPLMATFQEAISAMQQLNADVDRLEGDLAGQNEEIRHMETWIHGMGDILYQVFTAANLPQYAKDAIGDRYNHLPHKEDVDHAESVASKTP